MKKIIAFAVLFSTIMNVSAQETVTNRSGKEITVNSPATTTTQGQVKLAGDLGGTADLPTVPALSTKIDGSGTINYIPKFTATKTLGNSLLFDTGTYVGLGTVTPVSKFEISDASETFTGNGTVRISNSSAPTINNFAGLVFKSNNVSGVGGSWKIGSNQETATSYDQNFHFINSSNGNQYASKMTLTPSGNVGIGTTAPANKLEITQGTAGNSGLRFTNLNSSSTASTSSSKVLALNSTGDVILTNVPGTQNIVAFSVNADPRTVGTTFSPNTPSDPSVVYQSTIDNSMWTYVGSTYVTYTAPASTAWYTTGTTNDAGNSKTSNIYRSGSVGIGVSSPAFPLDVQSPGVATYVPIARFLAPSNTGVGNSSMLNFGVNSAAANSADWRYVYQGNGALTNRVDFGMSNIAAPMISYLNSGNVGVGTVAPLAKVHVQGIATTSGANANSPMLRMSRPTLSGVKYGSAAQFNLGAYDDGVSQGNAKSRLDLALTNIGDETTFANVMTWQANGNVGIGTTSPSAPLVVQANAVGTGVLKLAAPSVGADNWWMGFSHGINNSPDSNDRARIGVDIATGGSGRLFFTTGAPAAQTRAMFIDESQKVGIGTSAPTNNLDVVGGLSLRNVIGAAGSNYGMEFNTNSNSPRIDWVYNGSYTGAFSSDSDFFFRLQNSKVGSGGFRFMTNPSGTAIERLTILNNGNVGIGTSAPVSKLEVNGSATNTVAFNSGSATAILFNNSNLAYTSASPTAFSLQGMKDGGTYTLAVQGTTSGLASFIGLNPSGTSFTFLSVNNGATLAGKQTLYTFIVMGTTVYYYMATGFGL